VFIPDQRNRRKASRTAEKTAGEELSGDVFANVAIDTASLATSAL
jgi:hypothetical protein